MIYLAMSGHAYWVKLRERILISPHWLMLLIVSVIFMVQVLYTMTVIAHF
ncbi:hypothetical protein CKO_04358 [Citrobacter koseri ATCC BAA-895]|uniref:Uncharacterized protein n=1 Tax=Citrobacter koseri (strain ATCC BAA-895 / CDC 4225-83 / SGSC4696) TaxID=290338 RepID=A8APK1_CITK8|nr:hypothetical protein CKO_04358 [Citrobacter koseri ATCC BAA-895]